MSSSASRAIRWGVMGTGAIASAFAADLARLDDAEIIAVGSRSRNSADDFAAGFGIARAYASYEALVEDPAVDVVYVATPHVAHHACARAAIDAGKAVLVEKPFTLNAPEANDLVAAARLRGTFLMEAMWTRFLPHVVLIHELIRAGRIGEARSLTGELGGIAPDDDRHRILSPELGGGALLDIGVYLVSLASMLFGAPETICASGRLGPTGVDVQTAAVMSYPGGQHASLLTTIETDNANRANVNGTAGRIEIDGPFFRPAAFRLIDVAGSVEVFASTEVGHGLRHQAAEVGRCLRESLLESPTMPLAESVQVMATLDAIRHQIGLTYPGETDGSRAREG